MPDPKLAAVAYSGSVPANYEAYLGTLFFEPYARDLAARVTAQQPETVLEIACGTGRVTAHLAGGLPPGALIVATDINPAMLAEAQQRVPAGDVHVHWEEADGTDLPYDDAQFDAVVCQFGVMFYPDRPRGYAEARRVLRPGGVFYFNSWDALEQNPVGALANDVIAGFFPHEPPNFYRLPFAYHDEHQIRRDLEAAGWTDFAIESVAATGYSPSAVEAAHGLIEGTPVHAAIVQRDAALVPEIKAALEARLQKEYGDRDLRFALRAWVVSGAKREEGAR
jgi:SAM-dependent methyltransferase